MVKAKANIAGLIKARAVKAAKAAGRKARGAAYHPRPTTSNKPKKPKRVIKLKKFNYV